MNRTSSPQSPRRTVSPDSTTRHATVVVGAGAAVVGAAVVGAAVVAGTVVGDELADTTVVAETTGAGMIGAGSVGAGRVVGTAVTTVTAGTADAATVGAAIVVGASVGGEVVAESTKVVVGASAATGTAEALLSASPPHAIRANRPSDAINARQLMHRLKHVDRHRAKGAAGDVLDEPGSRVTVGSWNQVSRLWSATQAEFGDQRAIALDVDVAEVVEHAAAAADEHQ